MSIHTVKRSQCHLAWDNSLPPVLRIKSGEEVSFDCLDASNGQIDRNSNLDSLKSLIFSELDQVNGPIHIEEAEPGDVLQVDVLSVETADWGWTAIIPGFGLLSDDFTEPALKIWSLNKEEGFGWFDEKKKIKIPLRPFAGEMGVARGENGAFSTIPPYVTGGNLDTKYLTAGNTLFLPIEVQGALFSIGDGHAAQGDGEVCGTAIETPMSVKVRLTVLKHDTKKLVTTPHFKTSYKAPEEYYCTTGVDDDIRKAARTAVRSMIKYLQEMKGLTAQEAYMLCSVAGDLRLHEVVDMPNYVVGMMLPMTIFV